MENNKIVILALIVIIAALLIGMGAMMMPNLTKQDTKISFKGDSKINKGDSLKIKLTDANGNPIADQTVNITITDKDGSTDYHSVQTNDKGVGSLKLDKDSGKYSVTIKYNGNDKYKGCNDTNKITIKEEEVEETQTSSSSSTPSAYAYKSDGTPMYSQAEVSDYMYHKYGNVNYHIGSNGYVDMDQPGYDDAGHWVGYR